MSDKASFWAVSLAALGVVFGDIGTSPLYAINLLFSHHAVMTPRHIYGGISLVLWSLIVVVAIKYAVLALSADNDGEGGVFALYGLLDKANRGGRSLLAWALLLGAGLLLGDGVITPSISVLSATEGLAVAAPWTAHLVVPATLVLLTALFWVQKRGTGKVGLVFGPIMLAWFVSIGVLGAWQIAAHPAILAALSPVWGVELLIDMPFRAGLAVLGAVVLAVTGCEAMYADMGHFGAGAIRRVWFLVVLPALMLNYLGQGAWLLGHDGGDGLFFRMMPASMVLPAVLLATFATVIASQALISGTFSLIAQAIQLGFFPHLEVRHTDLARPGEVYVPFCNWLLFAGCVTLVLLFRSSSALGAAYGLAVSGVMLVTSCALWRLATRVWQWPAPAAAALIAPLALIDTVFLVANSVKLLQGGYVPLGIGAVFFSLMLVWHWGRQRTRAAYAAEHTMTIDELVALHQKAELMPDRTLVLMVPPRARAGRSWRVPLLAQVLWARDGVLARNVVFVDVVHPRQPYVHDDRFTIRVIDENDNGTIIAVTMRFGFMEKPDVEHGLEQLARHRGVSLGSDHHKWIIRATRDHLLLARHAGLFSTIRFRLFEGLRKISQPAYYHYGLGHDRHLTLEIVPVRLP
jgi:KUP system potassium uptake protein